jgi:hypothetical protein
LAAAAVTIVAKMTVQPESERLHRSSRAASRRPLEWKPPTRRILTDFQSADPTVHERYHRHDIFRPDAEDPGADLSIQCNAGQLHGSGLGIRAMMALAEADALLVGVASFLKRNTPLKTAKSHQCISTCGRQRTP